jgi:hypothetical protein
MKTHIIVFLLAANVAWSAVPAVASDCGTPGHDCRGALARVSRTIRTGGPKAPRHTVPGTDATRTQPVKREPRDSIDAWYRGG